MSQVNDLVKEIRESLNDKQKSASQKDELRVMQAMLNDKDYVVGVYGNSGKTGEYCPAVEARNMITSVIATATKVSKNEAATLADAHQFSKSEAGAMVGIAKEFVNTYAGTTRRLPLGGRETSNVTLQGVHSDATTTRYPKKEGVNADGTDRYVSTVKPVPAHDKIKASAPCPQWVK